MSPPVNRRRAAPRSATGKRPARKRILLVEDCAPLALVRSRFLAGQSYRVVCTADGKQAVERLQRESFDLVITDSELPSGSGWEVALAAKQGHVPVILSSGWPIRLPAEQMALRGVTVLARKPCTLSRLLTCVQAALTEKGVNRTALYGQSEPRP